MPDRPIVLGFDSSAAHCAAAVVSGDRILVSRIEPMAKGQAERLFPMLEEVLAEAGVRWSDLAALGVGIGPGNFTGIRISVAAARGLALSLDIPAFGVSVTEAAALDVPRPCRAVVALRGDEVVWQDFRDSDASAPSIAKREQLPPGLPEAKPMWPLPTAVALIAAHRLATGLPATRPAPLYLRPADAAPPRDPAPVIIP